MNLIIPVILLLILTACANNQSEKGQADYSTVDTAKAEQVISEESSEEEVYYTIEPTDTVSLGKYVLYFKPADSITFSPYYTDQEIRDSFWRVFGNSHDAANAVENYLKRELPGIFTSNDSTLTLQLVDGKKLVLPKCDEEEMRYYCFEGYFPEIDYILLYVQYYEGSAYALVNRKNGIIRQIHGTPYFSDNYKSFITVNVDMEANYSFNGIEYYTLTADSMLRQFELGITNWGPAKAKWINDKNIVLLQERMVASPDTYYYATDYTQLTIMRK